MRIRRRRDLHREDGAILAVVAMLVLAIFGMVALTVDVGGLLSLRRQMVTAADSAALAAAQSCATNEGGAAATASADHYATQNVPTAAQTTFSIEPGGECGPGGAVTVGYESIKELVFASVLGFPDEAEVGARATAMWGPVAAANPIPVMISEDWLTSECRIDALNLDQRIECLWDNRALASSSWGGLDLNAWDVTEGHHCSNEDGASIQKSWMSRGGIGEQLSVNDAPPTWVCATNGLRNSVVDTLDAYAKANPDNILYLPISRPPPLMRNANQFDKYNIVGFLAVRVIEAGHVSPPSIHGECKAKFAGPVTTGDEFVLDNLMLDCTGGYHAPFSAIDIQQVKELDEQGEPSGGNKDAWSFSGVETRMFTWTGDDLEHGLYIEFGFSRTGVAACGSQTTSDASAYCITFQWLGIQLLPGEVLDCTQGTCVSNVRAIRLIE